MRGAVGAGPLTCGGPKERRSPSAEGVRAGGPSVGGPSPASLSAKAHGIPGRAESWTKDSSVGACGPIAGGARPVSLSAGGLCCGLRAPSCCICSSSSCRSLQVQALSSSTEPRQRDEGNESCEGNESGEGKESGGSNGREVERGPLASVALCCLLRKTVWSRR